MMLLIAFCIACGIGIGIVYLLWPSPTTTTYTILKVCLGAGIGIGVTGTLFFIWLVAGGYRAGFLFYGILEGALLIAVVAAGIRAGKKDVRLDGTLERPPSASGPLFIRVLMGLFFITLLLGLFSFVFTAAKEPHGGWDAWMSWNMRARFFFMDPAHWQNVFSDVLTWSNPDYPELLPCSIARIWQYIGTDTTLVPILISLFFTFATIGVVSGAIWATRGAVWGSLSGAILLATPFFITHGAAQYADIPIGFFFASTVAIFALYDSHTERPRGLVALAGLAAALAAWTKNEGMLFFMCIPVARLCAAALGDGIKKYTREMMSYLAGAAPVLLITMYFKLFVAPPNRVIGTATLGAIEKFSDMSRYVMIVDYFTKVFRSFGCAATGTLPVLLVLLIAGGIVTDRSGFRRLLTGLITVGLMLAGYFFIYLQTPFNLAWQLGTSVHRLVAQLWPMIIFTFFMLIDQPDGSPSPSEHHAEQSRPKKGARF